MTNKEQLLKDFAQKIIHHAYKEIIYTNGDKKYCINILQSEIEKLVQECIANDKEN